MSTNSLLNSTAICIILTVSLTLHITTAHGDNDDHADATNLHSKALIGVKLWCLLILLISTFAAGISPYFYRWNETFLLLGTQFSGGIFLATSLIHFLSDSVEEFGTLKAEGYPFAFLLASIGYMLTMFGDLMVNFVANKCKSGSSIVEVEDGRQMEEECSDRKGSTLDFNGVLLREALVGDTMLLILALCFHSVFEGIAIGVAASEADAWKNLWTISLHKVFAAIAMGIALLRMLPKKPLVLTMAYSFSFAVSSPIGVGIGIAIDATTQGRPASWVYAISMGFASGVFIYVAVNHLIIKGFKPLSKLYLDTPLFKFVAVLLGVTVIAIVMIWD